LQTSLQLEYHVGKQKSQVC